MGDSGIDRVLSSALRAVDGTADLVLEDRYTDYEDSNGGGGGSVPSIPSPFTSRIDPNLAVAPKKHPLRHALDMLVGQKVYSHLHLALVDLSTNPKKPVYAGYKDTDQTFIGSTAKLGILVSAYGLREAARSAAGITAKDDKDFFNQLTKAWKGEIGKNFRGGKGVVNSLPRLSRILSATRSKKDDPFNVEFTKQTTGTEIDDLGFWYRLRAALKNSSNPNAGSCIHDLGFPYIRGQMKSMSFFDRKGLWLSTDYVGQTWDPSFKDSNAAGTARSVAEIVTLIGQDRMVVPGLLSEMRLVMAGEGLYAESDLNRGLFDRLSDKEKASMTFISKVGYDHGVFGDCVFVERTTETGVKLAYVAVAFGGTSHEEIQRVGNALDDCVLLAQGQAIKPPAHS